MNNARIEQEADLALCQVAIQCPDAIEDRNIRGTA